jgi:hypothetical protein
MVRRFEQVISEKPINDMEIICFTGS